MGFGVIEELGWTFLLAFLTMLGVWLGPLLAERWRRRHEVKEKVKLLISKLRSGDVETSSEAKNELLALGRSAIKPLRESEEVLKGYWIKLEIKKILYQLGDKSTEAKLFLKLKELLGNPDLRLVKKALDVIQELKIEKMAPVLFQRLEKEKDEVVTYELIRTLGTLAYKPALPYLLNRARSAGGNLAHAHYMAIGDIAGEEINTLNMEIYNQIIELFAEWLSGEDDWLVDGAIKDLRHLAIRKDILNEFTREKLIQALTRLLRHKRLDFRTESIDVLVELEAKKAVALMKECLEKETDDPMKRRIKRALAVLSG